MAFDNTVTVVGNTTREPELRFTPSGAAVCNFGVAWNRRITNARGETDEHVSFFDVTCWQSLAENVAESVTKGMRVVVYGRLEQRSWETPDGERRSKVELVADDVAPSLRWATADVVRNDRPDDSDKATSGRSNARGGRRSSNRDDYSEEPF